MRVVSVVEYEHPAGWTCRVLWRWEDTGHDTMRLIPVAVEFDLFTPLSVQTELTAFLEGVRVDRSLSVSALAEAEADDYPWD